MAKRKLFHGTMNASKSAQLLMQAYNFERQGKTFLIFQPKKNTRNNGKVKSRALNDERDALAIGDDELMTMLMMARFHQPDFIFVDEIQFMSKKNVDELAFISTHLDIPIFAYGLLISYTGELFEGSKRAIECGFSLQELKMQCDFCSNKSTHHLLYDNGEIVLDGEPIHVGDEEYKSVCYDCFRDKTNPQL